MKTIRQSRIYAAILFSIFLSGCVAGDHMNTRSYQLLEEQAWQALSENDTEKSEKYYRAALENRPFLKKIWPLSVELDMQMAFLYLRKEEFNEAAKYYGRAAGPWGFPFIDDLSARQKQLELFANVQPYAISGAPVSEIGFVKLDPLPVVSVEIEGSSLNFILDTGGEDLFVDDDVAKKLGIQAAGYSKITKGSAGGSGANTGYGKVDQMKVGEVVVENIPVSILDMGNISEKVFAGFQIDGIIGTRFLMHFLSTIDYKSEKLVLRQLTAENRKTFQDQLVNKSHKKIPFTLVATHMMLAEGSFNGQNRGQYFIDTGVAGAALHSTKARMKKSGVEIDWSQSITGAGVGGNAEALEVMIEEITLGTGENRIVKNDLRGVLMKEELAIFDGQPLGVEINGLISHEFFKGSSLTLDFEEMRLIIEE